MPFRLAIVLSHPTQYYSPWFRHLALQDGLAVKVFYLWDFGVKETRDRTFETSFRWDIPLLEGYSHEFIPNRSRDPGTHHFRGLNNPGAAKAVADWKPDAVLMFGYAYATHLRLIVSRRLAGVAFYFRGDSHELSKATGWKAGVNRQLRRLVFRRFHGFLAVGTANADYFRRCGVAADKIHLVPHCIDNDRFQASARDAREQAAAWRRELGMPEDATVVLFAGKFEEKKRPMDLLSAFGAVKAGRVGPPCPAHLSPTAREIDEEAKDQRSEIRSQEEKSPQPLSPTSDLLPASPVLLFVGSGPLEDELRVRAGSELGRSVFFAPFQNQSRMPMVYAVGDVIVLPSLGRGETWGLAINEAFNLGIPAIVSSHVGCGPDLVIEGKTGWVFRAGDVEALGACLNKALADREALRQMGTAAREHVGGYSYEVATHALLRALAPAS